MNKRNIFMCLVIIMSIACAGCNEKQEEPITTTQSQKKPLTEAEKKKMQEDFLNTDALQKQLDAPAKRW